MAATRMPRWITGAALTAPLTMALVVFTADSASAAVTATFIPSAGVLTVFGDSADNTIAIGRNPAGSIFVNGGAVPVSGGTPNVGNVALVQVFGLAGADRVRLDEAGGALPRANLFGGGDDDALTGGGGADQLFGQSGRDTILARGGNDAVFGGDDNDTLIAGDAEDQVFGERGDDLMIWNPGDDVDLNEGGDGRDTVRVEGSASSETFRLVANGTRARFDRVTPSPFSLDIGTSERFELGAADGVDSFTAGPGLGALTLSVNGGAGDDRLVSSTTVDVLLGGEGVDRLEAGPGADLVLPGPGDDVALGGLGADTINGDAGNDILLGGRGADRILGGPGFDVAVGGPGRDTATEAEDVSGVP